MVHGSTPGVRDADRTAESPGGLVNVVGQALARPPGDTDAAGMPASAAQTARGVDAGLSSVKLIDALLVSTCALFLSASLARTKALPPPPLLPRGTGGGELCRNLPPLDRPAPPLFSCPPSTQDATPSLSRSGSRDRAWASVCLCCR